MNSSRDTSKDKFDFHKWMLMHFPLLWDLVTSIPFLRRYVNQTAINYAIEEIPGRPNPLCCGWDFTTWEGLTNRRWSSRHLPPKVAPSDLPDPAEVAQKLFARDRGLIKSEKSTLLFPYFAQWFTDGFLDVDAIDRRRNYSNHEIDLSQLYGFHSETTNLVREHTDGRLISQQIAGAEFPPFLFDQNQDSKNLWDIKDEYRQKRETYTDYADIGPQHLFVRQPANANSGRQAAKVTPALMNDPLTFPPYCPDRPPHLVYNELRLDDSSIHYQPNYKTWFALANDRGNSTPAFVMMNVLMLREHNRIARALADEYRDDRSWNKDPQYFDERIFQTTRMILTVIVMKIVIEEYINHITPYYFKLFVNPPSFYKPLKWKWTNWMSVEFNMLYRWHSMIPDRLDLGDPEPLDSNEALWNPGLIIKKGLAPMFNYTSKQAAGRIGAKNTWDFLVRVAETPTIKMGRDAQVGTYNDYRELCGMQPVDSFDQISSDPAIKETLRELYRTPDRIEFYAGMFSEDLRPNSALAPLVGTLVGIDAFSQALTNPLLSERIYKPETFSALGWKIISEPQTIEALVCRNTPEYNGEYDIRMTQAGWKPK